LCGSAAGGRSLGRRVLEPAGRPGARTNGITRRAPRSPPQPSRPHPNAPRNWSSANNNSRDTNGLRRRRVRCGNTAGGHDRGRRVIEPVGRFAWPSHGTIGSQLRAPGPRMGDCRDGWPCVGPGRVGPGRCRAKPVPGRAKKPVKPWVGSQPGPVRQHCKRPQPMPESSSRHGELLGQATGQADHG
jgi:hypothetical protein